MTNELIAKAKECKSVEELLALAKENDYPLNADEAKTLLATLNSEGELSDDELDNASGGACQTTVDGMEYTVTTNHNKCFIPGGFKPEERMDKLGLRFMWGMEMDVNGEEKCGICHHLEFKGGVGYCGKSGKQK